MNKTFTQFFTKTPLILIACIFIATGCHTPEDLREIGPQQESIEEAWTPEGITSPTLLDPDMTNDPQVGPGDDGNQGGNIEFNLLKLKTPYLPSSRRRTCKGC